jgi:hypothetical protein
VLVRSQNKELLVNAILISITETKKKVEINAQYARDDALDSGNFVGVGEYQTKEIALKELDNIMQFFVENPSGVYQMK